MSQQRLKVEAGWLVVLVAIAFYLADKGTLKFVGLAVLTNRFLGQWSKRVHIEYNFYERLDYAYENQVFTYVKHKQSVWTWVLKAESKLK